MISIPTSRALGSAVALPRHRDILRLAWPIMLANCSTPLLGLVDTAVIGNTGSTAELGAIALGALLFSFAYWAFGFLRMGTTGFVAQADGQGDEAEVRAAVLRALALGVGIGAVLIALQVVLVAAAMHLFGASAEVETIARRYFLLRIWGAPAALAVYALMGLFIGLGRTGHILAIQVAMNGVNIALDALFAGVLGWGAEGIAAGTALAEWLALGLAAVLAWRLLRARHGDGGPFVSLARLRDRGRWLRTLGANTDIMVRTLLMLFAFAWFTNQGAVFGDHVLAANHILLQLVAFSAFFLDGYAHAVEPLVGRAAGGRDPHLLTAAVVRSTRLAAVTALVLALTVAFGGATIVGLLTAVPDTAETAVRYLPHTACYVLLSFGAFQLDGIFIGSSRTRAMRNASAISVAGFLLLAWPLAMAHGNDGLWMAFIGYVLLRAATLGACYPALRRSIGG